MLLVDEVRHWLKRQRNVPTTMAAEPFDELFLDFCAWNRDLASALREAKAEPGLSLHHDGRVVILQRLQGTVCYCLGPGASLETGTILDVAQACKLALAYLLREPLPKVRRRRWGRLPDGNGNGLVCTE